MTNEPARLEIDWLKVAAGALAAISSAVLLSTLGAAGTIAGAAIGSVALSTGSAFYSQGLARSRDRITRAQATALRRMGLTRAEVEAVAEEPARLAWRARLGLLPWRRIGLYAAGLFVAAVVTITAFEMIAGRSVASYTGGDDSDATTITQIVGGGSDTPEEEPVEPDEPGDRPGAPDPEAPPPATPDPDDPSSEAPAASPSPAPEPSTSPAPDPIDPSGPLSPAPSVAPQE